MGGGCLQQQVAEAVGKTLGVLLFFFLGMKYRKIRKVFGLDRKVRNQASCLTHSNWDFLTVFFLSVKFVKANSGSSHFLDNGTNIGQCQSVELRLISCGLTGEWVVSILRGEVSERGGSTLGVRNPVG